MFDLVLAQANNFQDICYINKLNFVSFDYKNLRRRRKFVDERDFPLQTLIRIKFNSEPIVQSAITLIVISILVSFLSA